MSWIGCLPGGTEAFRKVHHTKKHKSPSIRTDCCLNFRTQLSLPLKIPRPDKLKPAIRCRVNRYSNQPRLHERCGGPDEMSFGPTLRRTQTHPSIWSAR